MISKSIALLSPLTILLTSFVFIILYFINRFYIKPLLGVLYYKSQGVPAIFHKKSFPYLTNYQNALKHKTFYHQYKETFKRNPHAKVIVENIGSSVQLVCISPDAIKELLARHELFQKDKQLLELLFDAAKGTTVLAEENVWKRGRRILSSAFHYEFLKGVIPTIVETTKEKFNEWINDGDLSKVDLIEHFGGVFGEITGRFFFGKKFGGRQINGVPMTTAVQKITIDSLLENLSLTTFLFGLKFARLNLLPRHKDINQRIAAIRNECKQMIEDTKNSGKKDKNLLGLLLELGEGEKEDKLTDEQIIGEFVGLFVAGTDTTSHLMSSAIYFLWKNPHVLQKVKEEVYREFSDLQSLTIETVNKMEYTTAMFKEALRLGGPASALFTRIAVRDDEIAGIKVKKGTKFNFFHDVFFTSEKYFSRPNEFIPERWLENSEFINDGFKTQPYAFIPFSAGPRNCVGQHLALIEAKIIIGMFIKTFDFSFPEDYDFILVQRFTYEPLYPLCATLKVK